MKTPRKSFRNCRICKCHLRLINHFYCQYAENGDYVICLQSCISITISRHIDPRSRFFESISKNLPIDVFQIDRLNPIDWLFTSYRFVNNNNSIDKKKYKSIRINLSIVHFQIDRLLLIDWKFTTYRFKSHISQSIDKKPQSIRYNLSIVIFSIDRF
jgi:hypothetical protein